MSCIIGIIHKNTIYAGADSLIIQAEDGSKAITSDEKLFIKNGILIGSIGVPRIHQIMRYNMSFPKYEKGTDPLKYMVNKFVVKLQECLKKHGSINDGDSIQNFGDTAIMVGMKTPKPKLFVICPNFQVEEDYSLYIALGSGEKYAFGSLYTTEKENWSQKERIKTALEAAEKFNSTVGGPFIYKEL